MMEPELTLYPGSLPLEPAPGPSEEDWAVLATGQASPWLRQQLLEVVERDPEAAALLADFTAVDYQAAINEADAALHPREVATTATIQKFEPLPLEAPPVARRVEIRFRPSFTWFFLGLIGLAISFLIRDFFWQGFIAALVCFAAFLNDYNDTRIATHLRKAAAASDTELVAAIIEYQEKQTGS